MNFYTWLLDNRNKSKDLKEVADYMESLTNRAGLTRMHRMTENGVDFWKKLIKDADVAFPKNMESKLDVAYSKFSPDVRESGKDLSRNKQSNKVSVEDDPVEQATEDSADDDSSDQ